MGRPERVAAIQALEAARGGTNVISYITSTRPGIEGQMAPDTIAPVYRNLQAITTPPDDTRIDLFIHSNGGEGIVPWRLVTLMHEFCSELTVLVPHHAFSAATLTALGADQVLMHPMGMLGPTDPSIQGPFNPTNPNNPQQVLPVSVEDVASYIALIKEDVGIHHEDELIQAFLALADKVHPLALGSVKRTTSQSRMLGEKLLRRRRKDEMPASNIEEVVRKLTSELYFHGHPINAREAREDLGLHFVDSAPEPVAKAMWDLYEVYRADLQMDREFNAIREAIAKTPLPVPPIPVAPPGTPMAVGVAQATVALDLLRFAVIESTARADALVSQLEVTITRDHMGAYNTGGPQMLTLEWVDET